MSLVTRESFWVCDECATEVPASGLSALLASAGAFPPPAWTRHTLDEMERGGFHKYVTFCPDCSAQDRGCGARSRYLRREAEAFAKSQEARLKAHYARIDPQGENG